LLHPKSQALREHVAATVGRYRGRVRAWDVVNEAIADDRAGLRDTVYLRKLGPEYVAEAFALAHEADPGALLIYNDYGGEGLNRKSDDVYALVDHGIGVPWDPQSDCGG
jgi:endo-1,4-beta-xylanase